jgi:UDP-N-acetylglucosamine acyltransferase
LGEESLIIGDNCILEVIFLCGLLHGQTVIGDNCLIMASAHIAHDCHVGNNAIIVNGVLLESRNCRELRVVGRLSAVHQFINIGDHAMISGVRYEKDVPYTAKEPLSYVG